MKFKINDLGLAIAVGLIICGAMIPYAVDKYNSNERTVDVKGLCEREVQADKVIWPLQFRLAGNDLSALVLESESQTRMICDFLKKGGISENDITIATPNIDDRDAAEYRQDRVYRYVLKCVLTVCSSEVDKVISLQSGVTELMKKGIRLSSEQYGAPLTQFLFEGLNSIKPEMIEEATANAREAAEKFASDSHSRLGKIRHAVQGTFSISDRDSNTPYIKKVRVVTYLTYNLND